MAIYLVCACYVIVKALPRVFMEVQYDVGYVERLIQYEVKPSAVLSL